MPLFSILERTDRPAALPGSADRRCRMCEDIRYAQPTGQPHPNCSRASVPFSPRTFRSRKDFSETNPTRGYRPRFRRGHKTRSPDSLRRSGLQRVLLRGTNGLRHVLSFPDVACAQIPRIPVDRMLAMRTVKRGSLLKSRHHLGSLQALAIRHCWTTRYAGHGRKPRNPFCCG